MVSCLCVKAVEVNTVGLQHGGEEKQTPLARTRAGRVMFDVSSVAEDVKLLNCYHHMQSCSPHG